MTTAIPRNYDNGGGVPLGFANDVSASNSWLTRCRHAISDHYMIGEPHRDITCDLGEVDDADWSWRKDAMNIHTRASYFDGVREYYSAAQQCGLRYLS
jgi:hypothetical protein